MPHPAESLWHGRRWELPPLILHPFDRGLDAAATFDSIQLTLQMAGMGDPGVDKARLLRGRYTEFRMLSLAGKDVMRWILQCADFAGRDEVLARAGIQPQSFADFLVNRTPSGVDARFRSWGVLDYRRILSRAIGINAVFPSPPEFGVLSVEFLENYYAYADCLFGCYQRLASFKPLPPEAFTFALFTSDEYLSTLRYGPDNEET